MVFTTLIFALEVTIDGLNYYLNENNHEAIVSNGNKWHGKLCIPSEVTYDRQTYKITGLNWNAFHDCSELTNIKISHTIEDVTHYNFNYEKILISPDLMNPFTGCTALESIEVAEDNPSMKSIDGVLFSKDGTSMYCYPAGIKATSYVVPKGVTWVGIEAVSNVHLRKIDLSENLKTICSGAFRNCTFDVMIIRGVLDTNSVNGSLINALSKSARLYVPTSEVARYKEVYSGTVLSLKEYEEEELVTFTAGQMATIVLPTEPDASKGKYYRLAGCEEGQIVFEQELQPRAHVPYIIMPSEDFSIELNAAELAGLKPDTVSIKGVRFIGTYMSEVLPSPGGDGGDSYYDIIDKTPDCSLSPSGETGMRAVVGALRAYLEVNPKVAGWDDPYTPGGTRAPGSDDEKMTIVLKDDPSGLQMVNGKLSNDKCYDLQGRLQPFPLGGNGKGGCFPLKGAGGPGIYIQNGRKVMKQ